MVGLVQMHQTLRKVTIWVKALQLKPEAVIPEPVAEVEVQVAVRVAVLV